VCNITTDKRFYPLGNPQRIWAVSAVHGEAAQLMALHDALIERLRPGDRVVYLGNYLGYGPAPIETIDELLTFRRLALARPGMLASDIIYLRGGQEEMWEKLQQLQFAPNPTDVLLWMLGKGLSSTLSAYQISPHDGIIAAQEGVMSLTKWTGKIRNAIRCHPGHDLFTTQLRRAAFTSDTPCPLLFVHAGIDPARSLEDQGDAFWWAPRDFNTIDSPYNPYLKVIRGYDPAHRGPNLNCVTATIDGGCGFGGNLVCAGFTEDGALFDILEA